MAKFVTLTLAGLGPQPSITFNADNVTVMPTPSAPTTTIDVTFASGTKATYACTFADWNTALGATPVS